MSPGRNGEPRQGTSFLLDMVLGMYRDRLTECAQMTGRLLAAGGTFYAFGAGGDTTCAQEIAEMFQYPRTRGSRPARAWPLTAGTARPASEPGKPGAGMTAASRLASVARPGDIALGLAAGGGSEVTLRTFEEARGLGMATIGLAGYDGGRMAETDAIDYLFVIPSLSAAQVRQTQAGICRALWTLVQQTPGRGLGNDH